jgi:hypothetical protein
LQAKLLFSLLLIILGGCSLNRSKTAPFIGSVAGGTAGAALGGIPGAAIGTGAGYASGIIYDWAAVPSNSKTLEGKIISAQMDKHATGQLGFFNDLKKVLIYAAAGLAVYLTIPLIYARKCTKDLEKGLTKAPFPRPSDKT